MSATSGDTARVSVFVAVAPADAFAIFTREIDVWWRHGPAYRIAGKRRGRLVFEEGPSGRLFETFELPSGPRTFEVGRVVRWEPPARLCLEWRNVNFKEGEHTLVDVAFQPQGDGTLVTVTHSGWSALPENHPARHGNTGPAMSRMIGMWWSRLLGSLREHVVTSRA